MESGNPSSNSLINARNRLLYGRNYWESTALHSSSEYNIIQSVENAGGPSATYRAAARYGHLRAHRRSWQRSTNRHPEAGNHGQDSGSASLVANPGTGAHVQIARPNSFYTRGGETVEDPGQHLQLRSSSSIRRDPDLSRFGMQNVRPEMVHPPEIDQDGQRRIAVTENFSPYHVGPTPDQPDPRTYANRSPMTYQIPYLDQPCGASQITSSYATRGSAFAPWDRHSDRAGRPPTPQGHPDRDENSGIKEESDGSSSRSDEAE